jgi:hypothetical protein
MRQGLRQLCPYRDPVRAAALCQKQKSETSVDYFVGAQ